MKDDAAGGITPELLLRAYASGVFPMAESADAEALFWVDPERRGILPLDGLRVSRRLARSFRGGDFAIRVDADFAGVVDACADRPETWINPTIRRALPRAAPARPGALGRDLAGRPLAGGLYGVALGAAFFGESMFSRARDASKLALIALVARLNAGGFRLLDTQFVTDHLASLGAIEIRRADYHRRLAAALARPADFRRLPATAARAEILALAAPP